ncbi:hypothetical protein LCGC14_2421240 [marine sediment metagenome]|uniref:Inosine/uridine-preferring nucleoside hydrolase domain-containing protein n=1 Tax=marine sediment metagenome TaxID=412755 RepID=A0A0F9E1N8_9ZZZZ
MKNILIDTDIGDDIDDALAVAVALDQTLVKMELREVNLVFRQFASRISLTEENS